MEPGQYIAVGVIVGATAVLAVVAAAETALERSHGVRIQALAARGDMRAKRITGTVEQPRELLGPLTSARVFCAAFVVAMFIYLGADSQGVLSGVFLWGGGAAVYVALVEMTVGLLAARAPERAAIELSGMVRVARLVFGLPAFLLSLPARLIARSLTAVSQEISEDVLSLVEREEAAGGVEEQGSRMIRGVLKLEDTVAREIMVPRIDIAGVPLTASIADAAAMVKARGFSRLPVYEENIDDIAGLVYAKDLLSAMTGGDKDGPVKRLLRPATFIPESKRLDELLTEMRATRSHLAIVVDEYGGTAGLVTIEDLLEEIVGEIEDEFDPAAAKVERISDDEVILDASMPVDVMKELFDYDLESEDFDTVGGLVIHRLGRLPSVGDEVRIDGLRATVLSMTGRRIRRLRVARAHEAEPVEEPA